MQTAVKFMTERARRAHRTFDVLGFLKCLLRPFECLFSLRQHLAHMIGIPSQPRDLFPEFGFFGLEVETPCLTSTLRLMLSVLVLGRSRISSSYLVGFRDIRR